MSVLARPRYQSLSPEEYLAWERQQDGRHEYCDGHVIEMQGASDAHATITANILGNLFNALRGNPCRVRGNDVKVKASTSYRYPDVLIVCGPREYSDEDTDVLLNPTVLIEVLSPSTENMDRTTKLREYQAIESVKEILHVDQDKAFIVQFTRRAESDWSARIVTGLDETVSIEAVGVELPMAAVYEDVTFTAMEDR